MESTGEITKFVRIAKNPYFCAPDPISHTHTKKLTPHTQTHTLLSDGVTAALEILVLSAQVRILVRQQKGATYYYPEIEDRIYHSSAFVYPI